MKDLKKLFMTMMAALMLMGVVTGCSSEDTEKEDAETEETETTEEGTEETEE